MTTFVIDDNLGNAVNFGLNIATSDVTQNPQLSLFD